MPRSRGVPNTKTPAAVSRFTTQREPVGGVQEALAPVDGVEVVSAIGDVVATGTASAVVSGVAATSAIGTATASGTASATTTGVESTSAIGTVSGAGTATAAVTGVAATSAIGDATATGTATAAPLGVEVVSAIGAVIADGGPVDATAIVTGVGVVSAIGSATATVDDVKRAVGTFPARGGRRKITHWVQAETPPSSQSETGRWDAPAPFAVEASAYDADTGETSHDEDDALLLLLL